MTYDLAKAIRKFVLYDTQLSDKFDEGDVYYGSAANRRTTGLEPPILVFNFIPSGSPERGFDGGRVETTRVQLTVYHNDHDQTTRIIDLIADKFDRRKLAFDDDSTRINLSMMAVGGPLIRPEAKTSDNKFAWSATRDFEAKVQI